MPKAFSLHIGLNEVDPAQYAGWNGKLNFAEQDAEDMFQLARKAKFAQSIPLLGEMATRENVLENLKKLAKNAHKDDLVMITYSGHGALVPDTNEDEEDKEADETWCCYDGQLLDDELKYLWTKFKPGVRIILFSDSCHSGDIAKNDDPNDLIWQAIQDGAKFMPLEKSFAAYKANQAFYDKIQKETPLVDLSAIKASIKQFAGCHEDGFSYEGLGNGQFTKAMKSVWKDGAFTGTYQAFFDAIVLKMKGAKQTPKMQHIGPVDPGFETARAFTIEQGVVLNAPPRPDTSAHNLTASGSAPLLVNFGPASKSTALIGEEHYSGVNEDVIGVFSPKSSETNDWDRAHALYDQLKSDKNEVLFVEPELEHETIVNETTELSKSTEAESYLPTWPHPKVKAGNEMWHLSDQYSQLGPARDSIMNDPDTMAFLAQKPIRIAHFDTGFFPFQDFMPEKLLVHLAKSFVPGESENLGVDFKTKGLIPPQQGHGAATLALLAGPKVNAPKGLEGFSGYIGAVPFAEVIPIRIQDSVALLKTRAFERAIYYAIEQGCEVITMSMAGAPSRRWVDAVNAAYEKGITIVTAAGNSWRKGGRKFLPEYLLYPARFERVIAAAGVSHNKQPYNFVVNTWEEDQAAMASKSAGGIDMQGNHGPEEQMWHVAAGYTPNVIWAETDELDANGKPKTGKPDPHFIFTGGGTSSATPQVAATAALWIAKHRKQLQDLGYTGTWRQVEAVRHAIFSTGELAKPEYRSHIGNGGVKAMNALRVLPLPAQQLVKSPTSSVPFLPLFSTLLGFAKSGPGESPESGDPVKAEMMALELAQLASTEPEIADLLKGDWSDSDALDQLRASTRWEQLLAAIKASKKASDTLKKGILSI